MQVKFTLKFNDYEIDERLSYKLISEFYHSSFSRTGKVKKAMSKTFTREEMERIRGINVRCDKWYLKTGVSETFEIPLQEYDLWCKYVKFICSVRDIIERTWTK